MGRFVALDSRRLQPVSPVLNHQVLCQRQSPGRQDWDEPACRPMASEVCDQRFTEPRRTRRVGPSRKSEPDPANMSTIIGQHFRLIIIRASPYAYIKAAAISWSQCGLPFKFAPSARHLIDMEPGGRRVATQKRNKGVAIAIVCRNDFQRRHRADAFLIDRSTTGKQHSVPDKWPPVSSATALPTQTHLEHASPVAIALPPAP